MLRWFITNYTHHTEFHVGRNPRDNSHNTTLLGASNDIMVNKLSYQTTVNEFESHRASYFGLCAKLSLT